MSNDADLKRRLGLEFRDPALLSQALTHRSAGRVNNERLEFLGDGLLNFVIADLLCERFPTANEGDLSRLRVALVRRETLADIALRIGLGEHLRLGGGELKSGGYRNPSILADSLEALLGAAYQDQGLAAVRALIERLYADEWSTLLVQGPDLKDPKTRLQEWLQQRGQALPTYQLVQQAGLAHAAEFEVEVVHDGLGRRARGRGASRRAAEQAAARALLAEL